MQGGAIMPNIILVLVVGEVPSVDTILRSVAGTALEILSCETTDEALELLDKKNFAAVVVGENVLGAGDDNAGNVIIEAKKHNWPVLVYTTSRNIAKYQDYTVSDEKTLHEVLSDIFQ